MNFKQMPELESSHGYMIAASLTGVSTLLTYLYFKKRNWF
jgi:Mg2+ and Co2+ transporter CorA